MFVPNEIELAWAAGLFDGEGCTTYSRRYLRPKCTQARLVIMQSGNPEVLFRFWYAVGKLGKVHGPYGPYASGGQKLPNYQYTTSRFEHIQAVIALLWKHLGSAKRDQAAKCLKYVNLFEFREA